MIRSPMNRILHPWSKEPLRVAEAVRGVEEWPLVEAEERAGDRIRHVLIAVLRDPEDDESRDLRDRLP